MISALTGQLRSIDDDRVHVQVGAILYELMVPAADIDALRAAVGQEMTFHTIFYLEGDASRGGVDPKLVGFLRPKDRRFFEKFTTVKGIGVRTALKALTVPVAQIAQSIESRDARSLTQLKGIGKRTAELMIAELAGKVTEFALEAVVTRLSPRSQIEEDALNAVISLGESRIIAERLLEQAKQEQPQARTAGELMREMLKLRA